VIRKAAGVSNVDNRNGGSTPRPDPTILTTTQLLREVDALRTLVRGWVDALQVLMESQIKGAVENIVTRLNGNDTALVAALQAQKEAAAKQTENFTAILNESKLGVAKQVDAMNEKIDDLKERLSEQGGKSSGISSTVTMVIAITAAMASVIAVVLSFSRETPVVRSLTSMASYLFNQ